MIRFSFELPTELYKFSEEKGEQPYSVSREENASLHERAGLTKLITACGINLKEVESFEIEDLIGKTLMLTIDSYEIDGETYNGIQGYSMIPKGLPVGDAVNDPIFYDCDAHDDEVYESLPQFIKDKIDTARTIKAQRDSVIDF